VPYKIRRGTFPERLLINSDEAETRARFQLQPQPPTPQQGPAGTLEFAEASDEPFLAGALKTESCNVWRRLAHFGHAIFVLLESTICSYRVPQSSQRYS